MATTAVPTDRLSPLHAVLLAFPTAFFPAALLADVTYLASAEMQWSNFAAWAITGALLVGAPALGWSVVAALRRRGRQWWLHPLLLAVAWLIGLVNAFHHSGDAWSSVGVGGLILSIVSSVTVVAAAWIAFSSPAQGAVR